MAEKRSDRARINQDNILNKDCVCRGAIAYRSKRGQVYRVLVGKRSFP